MKEKNESLPIEIFAGTLWEAEMVKSLLENSDITAYLLDEYAGSLAPWYTAAGGAGSVKVIVSNQDLEQAKMVVDEFVKNSNSAN